MDNDNKIKNDGEGSEVKDLVEQSKLIFLKEIIDEFRKKQAQYDLGAEFAKTKKNRSPIVPLVVFGMTLLFILGAVAVTLYIQEMSRNITVGIQEFEDVNLKDVLDAAKRNEQEIQQARRELEALESAMEGEILAVREETRRELDFIAQERISQEEKDRKSQAVRVREARRIDAIRAAYNPKIAAKNKDIKAIQAKIDEYDSRQVEKARKQEEILNNQQRLFQIELEKTTKYYEDRIAALNAKYNKDTTALKNYHKEFVTVLNSNHAKEVENLTLKYNPKMADPEIVSLLAAAVDQRVYKDPVPGKYRPLLEAEGVLRAEEFRNMEQTSREYERIMAELRKIPYINSVPGALKQLDFRHRVMARGYETMWNKLTDSVAVKNEKIDQFFYALDNLQKNSRENGYILDPRNPKSIKVYMNKARVVSDGMIGLVFRRDDEYIGKIRFFRQGEELVAAEQELNKPGVRPEPFDKVLIQEQ